jgi:hypothetical protein
MVELTLRREHVNGHMSFVTVAFVSLDKAIAAIATWNSKLWFYTIVGVDYGCRGDGHYVTCNGQLI